MPIRYTIDSKNGVVYTTASGTLTEDELLAHKRALMRDPAFNAGMKELSDIRAVEHLDVSVEAIQGLAKFDREHTNDVGEHQLGLLVPTDFVFGMARMYEMMTEGNTAGVVVFRDEAEAKAWVGLGEAPPLG
jgi:hypothetical protein